MSIVREGETEPILALVLDALNEPVVGSDTIKLKIWRISDSKYLDWSDMTFKTSSSVTQLLRAMTEVNPDASPGVYSLNFNTAALANPNPTDTYEFMAVEDGTYDADNLPSPGELEVEPPGLSPRETFIIHQSYFYDDETQLLRGFIWVEHRNLMYMSPVTIDVKWYATDGTELLLMHATASDISGVFKILGTIELETNAAYYAYVSITIPGIGILTNTKGIFVEGNTPRVWNFPAEPPPIEPTTNTVVLNENYGGEHNLQYRDVNNRPISEAEIRVYRKADYDLENFDALVGLSQTDINGNWVNPVTVMVGYTYTIEFHKPGAFGPDAYTVTIGVFSGNDVPIFDPPPPPVPPIPPYTPPTIPPSNTVVLTENYGGVNQLQYCDPSGNPINEAEIRVYTKTDYDLGNLDAIIGISETNEYGGWVNPITVDLGLTYTIQFHKPGAFGPDVLEVIVPS